MAVDRFTIRVAPTLRERVVVRAATEGVRPSVWVRAALEAALASAPPFGAAVRGVPVATKAEVAADLRGLRGEVEAMAGGRVVAMPEPAFGCPTAGCSFVAGSARARCGAHGRTVVSRVLSPR